MIISTDQFENEYAISYYSPKFVWLLKDTEIKDRDENNNLLSSDAFLEQNLKFLKNQQGAASIELFSNLFKIRSSIDFPPLQKLDYVYLQNNLGQKYKE